MRGSERKGVGKRERGKGGKGGRERGTETERETELQR